jgi:peroxiredoxin
MNENLTNLPKGLPEPIDDGLCDHLLGQTLSSIEDKYVILYFLPMMAIPGNDLPVGWNRIPGARGCTPQHIAIDYRRRDLLRYNAIAIGISSQPVDLSQQLISDDKLEFKKKLNLPTFSIGDKIYYKRVTLIVKDSKIVKVFYPIFPPDKHIFEIIKWLKNNTL